MHEANAEYFVAFHKENVLLIYQSDFKNPTKIERFLVQIVVDALTTFCNDIGET